MKPRAPDEIQCDCEEDNKPSFWQSKRFLGTLTLFAALMLAFPSYSHLFYFNPNQQQGAPLQTNQIKLIDLEISGMTSTGCEEHVKHTANQVKGVIDAKASYEKGHASIRYDPDEVSEDEIVEAINGTR